MIIKTYLVSDIIDYDFIFQEINLTSKSNHIIFFKGELGSGKTSFIKQLLNKVYNFDEVTSPTFGIINTYLTSNISIFHYDLYRVKELSELDDIGLFNNLELDGLHLIEWPEIIPEKLIKPNITVSLQVVDNHRLVSIENYGE